MDLSKFARGKYLKAADLNGPTVATMVGGRVDVMQETGESKAVLLLEDLPPLVLNKTNLEAVRGITGTLQDANEWRGYQCILQVEKVAFSGKMVDGIRLYPVESRASRPQTRPAPVEAEPPHHRPAPVRGRVADPSAVDEPVAPRKPIRGIPRSEDIPF